MDVKIIPAEKWKRYIEVTMPAAEVETRVDKALQDYRKKVQLHGFRKGKAPLQLVKQIYGDAVRQETIEEIVPEILSEAREKNNLRTVGPANLEDVNYDEKEGLKFRAHVEVAPEIELRKYKGLEFEKTVYEIEDQDVTEALENLREQRMNLQLVDSEVKSGHFVKADLQKVNAAGFPIIGDKYEDRHLQVLDDDEFTKPLIGAKVGDSRHVSHIERHPDGKPAEQATFYQVSIKEISEKVLPPLDETFAAEFGNVATLEELKKLIGDDLARRAEFRSEENLRRDIMDELLKLNAFELPEQMAETYAKKFAESVKSQFTGIPVETLENEARTAATRRLRWELLQDRIAEAEGITIPEEEMREHLISRALAANEDPQRLINQTMNDRDKLEKLRGDLEETKVLQFLKSQMQIRERREPFKDRGQQRIITV